VILAAGFVAVVMLALFAVSAVSGRAGGSTGSDDAGTASATSGSTATDSPSPATGGPRVAFYGDSYTLGTGASDPAKRWSTVISAERGWDEFNPSVNGLGFVNNRSSTPPDYGPDDEVPLVIADDPDILFITMGLNDNFSMPERADEIQDAISTDLRTLKDALPETRILVVEPFWYTDDRPDSVETVIGWVRAAAEEIGADWIPGASHWIEGHPEWMAADGLHPNDQGYAEMATRMDAELDRLGL